MTGIISFDPGYATGYAGGFFSDDEPLTLVTAGVVPYEEWPGFVWDRLFDLASSDAVIVSEKFTLRDNDFRADLTPVKIEGSLELLLGTNGVHWRDPSRKHQIPDQLLKDLGWWKTGADVSWEDGRDANDAIIHMLGYVVFELKHRPTLDAYF